MSIDLKKIKETAQATADKHGDLLVTIPAWQMLELVMDVERYRWLRSNEYWGDFAKPGEPWIVNARDEVSNQTGEELDAGVDFAMAKEAE